MKVHAAVRFPQLTLLVLVLLGAAAAAWPTVAAAVHPPHPVLRGSVLDFEFSSVTPAGAVQAGSSGNVSVVINRQGGHTATVQLTVQTNPQGITGTGSVPGPGNNGSLTVTVPAQAAAGTFWLTLVGNDGFISHPTDFQLTVSVVPAVISSFTATPPTIQPGQQSTLAYTFSGGSGVLDHGVGAVTSGGTAVVSPSSTTTYTLTVTPVSGPAATRQATVTVASGNATMSSARAYHSETLLGNGKVLLAGGVSALSLGGSYTVTSTADLYDPASGLLNSTGPLGTVRWGHTATLLKNGKVLLAGGFINKTDGTATAEVYDPASGSFSATAGPLHYARGGHTATLLPSGEVLIVGGYSGKTNDVSHYPAVCEIYNPATNSFRDSGSLNAVRGAHRATPNFVVSLAAAAQSTDNAYPVLDNRVLISGGYSATGFVIPLEWYSVGTDSFTPAGFNLINGRAFHTAVQLPNGKVLFAGGGNSASLPITTVITSELFDAAGASIAATGSLNFSRAAQASNLVNGKVLLSGGVTGYGGLLGGAIYTSVESYDPASGTFTTLGPQMAAGRAFHTSTLLGNGKLLLAGGLNASASGFILNSVELYTPPAP